MFFDAHFSLWQVAHFFAGFCHQAVVFRTAFFDTRFRSSRAKRGKIICDALQHFIYQGGDRFGSTLQATYCVCELALGIKAAFEGNTLQIHIVGERRLLHYASHEVIGNKVHPEFAFDHVGGAASQDIHLELALDLAKVEFDAPAPSVKSRKIFGGDARIGRGCNGCHALGSKTLVDNTVADNADIDALWQ